MASKLWRFLRIALTLGWFLLHTSAYKTLSDDTLRALPDTGNDFDIHDGALLAPILRPRVPGTPASLEVLQHFVDFFKKSLPEWTIAFQNSTSKTPATGDKEVPFVNLIATRDPPWASVGDVGRLALVAHYDSKITPEGFIGAVDSAAPCAMIMHAARSINKALTKKWKKMEQDRAPEDLDEEPGIQIILTDGEEAFLSWTATDSCYGARSLAEAWEDEVHPAMSTYRTPLSSISLFVLLDLLGSKNPTVPSYFVTTHWAYQNMAHLETRLRSLYRFESSSNHPKHAGRSEEAKYPRQERLFLPETNKQEVQFLPPHIGDDHEPFMARGVDILHIIPSPFPDVWHRIEDDGEHLDSDTVTDWALLVTAFAAEWMELEGYLESSRTAPFEKRATRDGASYGPKDEL